MSNRSTPTRVEGAVQVTIMLAIGSAAAAASFTHVHDVALAHGQPGWLAWADAVVLELMSIATGLEMRRRHRIHQSAKGPFAVLLVGVVLSLSAQILQAEQSIIGWIAAAIPALGFLAMAKMALGRTPATPAAAVPVAPAPASSVMAQLHAAPLPAPVSPAPAGAHGAPRRLSPRVSPLTGQPLSL